MNSAYQSPSPSRTYVAMCNTIRFDGFYFRRFKLPESEENTPRRASWYFLNLLDVVACIEGVIAWENFHDFDDQDSKQIITQLS